MSTSTRKKSREENYDDDSQTPLEDVVYTVVRSKSIVFVGIYNAAMFVFTVGKLYLLWILMHYFASHFYIKYCVPPTFMGLIVSPFFAPAPHCKALRWVIYTGGLNIETMFTVLGTWVYSKISM
jgi:hypothetical protein